jgi:antitoxin MazE
MKSTIRNIGNSKGIILPQNILKECQIEYEVNIEVKDNSIVISPVEEQKRKGWAEAFQEMAKNGDDELLIPDVFEDEDFKDWTWK